AAMIAQAALVPTSHHSQGGRGSALGVSVAAVTSGAMVGAPGVGGAATTSTVTGARRVSRDLPDTVSHQLTRSSGRVSLPGRVGTMATDSMRVPSTPLALVASSTRGWSG